MSPFPFPLVMVLFEISNTSLAAGELPVGCRLFIAATPRPFNEEHPAPGEAFEFPKGTSTEVADVALFSDSFAQH